MRLLQLTRRVLGTALALGLLAGSAQAASDRFRLVWTDDPATTATIGWQQVSGNSPVLEYRLHGSSDAWQSIAVTNTTSYQNTAHGAATILESQFVSLSGLSADTDYEFRIVDSEGSSAVMWFRTAPNSPEEFTFIAGGDSRTNDEPRQHGNQLVAKIRPLFVLYNGDFMDDGTYSEWLQWLDEWQDVISSDGRIYPIVPVHGNHENDVTDMMQKIFNITNPDAYFTLGVGGDMLRLYVLNSELEPGVGYGAFTGQTDAKWNAQAAWFASELANPANNATWKVTSYHRPMRPHTSGKPEGTGRIAAWAQPMFDNGVDLAVESDTHMTKYTYPLEPSEGAGSMQSFRRNDAAGTLFVGEGSWGAPTRPTDDDKAWTMDSDSFWQFKLIHATPTHLDIHTVFFGSIEDQNNGIIFDPNTVTELSQAAQDAAPLAMPTGLRLWQPLTGESLRLYDTGTSPRFDANINAETLVGTGSEWRYLDNGSDQGSAWKETGFDDSAWAVGNAQLGYGDGDETTTISFGPDSNNKYTTSYFRSSFYVNDPSAVIKLQLRLLRDDGAVVYINGQEVVRDNLQAGAITAATYAADAVGGSAESTYFDFALLTDVLVAGNNTIAVEVHQSDASSSDLSFDLDLTAVVSNTGSVSAPAAPSNLALQGVNTSSISFTWQDNASDEVNLELQRRVGSGAWEVIEQRLWANSTSYDDVDLDEGQQYSYRLRAYNAGGLSAYSNELTAETAVNPTPVIIAEDFNNCVTFDEAFENFIIVDAGSATRDWHRYEFPNGSGECFARANGYGGDEPADDWLISKALQLNFYSNESLTFELAKGFDDSGLDGLQVLVSTDYDADVHTDPSAATWIDAGVPLPTQNDYTFFPRSIDLNALGVADASKVFVAFRYQSSGTGGGSAAVWEVDDFELRGDYTPPLIDSQNFENGLGDYTPTSSSSDANWGTETHGEETGAFMNGYGSNAASDDWLVSPLVTIDSADYAVLTFDYYHRFDGPEINVYASAECSDPANPTAINWTEMEVDFSGPAEEWNNTGLIDLSGFTGSSVCIAFRYVSTGTGGGDGRRWGVDNVEIQKSLGVIGVDFEASLTTPVPNEPVLFTPSVTGAQDPVSYSWTFGDGAASSQEMPTHAFTTPGQYTIQLNVQDAGGKSGVRTRTNYIVVQTADPIPARDDNANLRIATFNILFAYGDAGGAGRLISNLSDPTFAQARAVAEIIQRIRPDVLLLNEFDYDELGPNGSSEALRLFRTNFLEVSQNGADPIDYAFDYIAPANTGVQPEDELGAAYDYDFSNSGGTDDPEDAFGFGYYPGAYGMAVLSQYPVDTAKVRTFRSFLWRDMPGALLPADPADSDNDGDLSQWYNDAEQEVFRLSSKSHWDIPVNVDGNIVHVLGSHPTPPVFDGAEDRNGTRNHDEIRLWADYVTPGQGDYLYDDNGRSGGIGNAQRFVMLGDQNADPVDGDSTGNAILQVLNNPNFNSSFIPRAAGAGQQSDDSSDTADFGLRADYVVPSVAGLSVQMNSCDSNDPKLSCGIFWPSSTDVLYPLVQGNLSSDHRLVWMDLSVDSPANDADGDGVGDEVDNCINVANPYQYDSNGDGFGNRCDADLDNNGVVTGADFALLRQKLGSDDADADLDGNGVVTGADFAIMRAALGSNPGPSALNP